MQFQYDRTASRPLERGFSHMSHGGFYVLLLGNAFLLVVLLDISLDRFLFLHDANQAYNLPSNAIADAAAATAICRRGDHK